MDNDENSKILYVCPMHPEIRQQQPGKCTKRGMDLEANSRKANN